MLCDLLFADDCALVAHSLSKLQHHMGRFAYACKVFGLTISTKKTEIVYQPPPKPQPSPDNSSSCQIVVNNVTQSEKFQYLGSTITENATLDAEIQFRLAKASAAYGKLEQRLWKSHNVCLLTKIAVYKAVVISALLYGCETWTPYRRQIQLLDAFHMRKLRCICNITRKDKVTNHDILT